jgi:hypothetical protein
MSPNLFTARALGTQAPRSEAPREPCWREEEPAIARRQHPVQNTLAVSHGWAKRRGLFALVNNAAEENLTAIFTYAAAACLPPLPRRAVLCPF